MCTGAGVASCWFCVGLFCLSFRFAFVCLLFVCLCFGCPYVLFCSGRLSVSLVSVPVLSVWFSCLLSACWMWSGFCRIVGVCLVVVLWLFLFVRCCADSCGGLVGWMRRHA